MKRTFTSYPVTDTGIVKQRMLNWSKQFSIFCLLNDQQPGVSSSFECLLGAGAIAKIEVEEGLAFESLQRFVDEQKDWCLGHLSYDLKNETEELTSSHEDNILFPGLFFFVPEVLLLLKDKELQIGVCDKDPDLIFKNILSTSPLSDQTPSSVKLTSRFSKEEYINTIEKLRGHILKGDCYEINFCQEFYNVNADIDPINAYNKLSSVSPNPFSALYRLNSKYLLCASPERYLKKSGSDIISQPIKGTAKRDLSDNTKDDRSKEELITSVKERSENVMIVDLVRNDLSKVADEATVKVTELFGIYSFPQVHQMISTVAATLSPGCGLAEIFKATFPMGSMTGAPKKRVMELIEKYERTKRGIFSGAIGYISPEGDFDFNVVIRSIMYNAESKYVSVQVGSAITFYCNAEDEYKECLLKLYAMEAALSS